MYQTRDSSVNVRRHTLCGTSAVEAARTALRRSARRWFPRQLMVTGP